MNKGFTLSEVLITLVIIGIVAATTIPTIVTKIQNKGYIERFKKAYSSLQQATIMIEQETGISAKDFGNISNRDLYNLYVKSLNLTKTAETTEYGNATIIKNYQKLKCKYLNNSEANCYEVMNLVAYPFPQLQDGTIIVFRPLAAKPGAYDWGINALESKASFTIDVNGLQKPNQLGRDIFRVYLHNNGKIYAPNSYADNGGVYGADCDPKAEFKKSRGYSCSYRIVTEGKMNY